MNTPRTDLMGHAGSKKDEQLEGMLLSAADLFVAAVSFAYCFELSKCQLSFSKLLFRNHKCYVSTLRI